MLYYGLEVVAKNLFHSQIGSVQGVENLPPPPCILCANHVSPYDPVLLVLMLYFWLNKYNKKIYFLTNRKVILPFTPFRKYFGMFRGTKSGLMEAISFIKKGIPIGIFPNRDRKPGQIRRFHLGPAYLALKANVPIVPIGIKTNEEVNPSWDIKKIIRSFRDKKHLIIDKPIVPSSNDTVYKLTEQLTQIIGNLINKKVV